MDFINMTPRQKLKSLGLDYHKIAEFFGYSSAAFANSTRRELIETGVLKVIEHVQAGGQNKNLPDPIQIEDKEH